LRFLVPPAFHIWRLHGFRWAPFSAMLLAFEGDARLLPLSLNLALYATDRRWRRESVRVAGAELAAVAGGALSARDCGLRAGGVQLLAWIAPLVDRAAVLPLAGPVHALALASPGFPVDAFCRAWYTLAKLEPPFSPPLLPVAADFLGTPLQLPARRALFWFLAVNSSDLTYGAYASLVPLFFELQAAEFDETLSILFDQRRFFLDHTASLFELVFRSLEALAAEQPRTVVLLLPHIAESFCESFILAWPAVAPLVCHALASDDQDAVHAGILTAQVLAEHAPACAADLLDLLWEVAARSSDIESRLIDVLLQIYRVPRLPDLFGRYAFALTHGLLPLLMRLLSVALTTVPCILTEEQALTVRALVDREPSVPEVAIAAFLLEPDLFADRVEAALAAIDDGLRSDDFREKEAMPLLMQFVKFVGPTALRPLYAAINASYARDNPDLLAFHLMMQCISADDELPERGCRVEVVLELFLRQPFDTPLPGAHACGIAECISLLTPESLRLFVARLLTGIREAWRIPALVGQLADALALALPAAAEHGFAAEAVAGLADAFGEFFVEPCAGVTIAFAAHFSEPLTAIASILVRYEHCASAHRFFPFLHERLMMSRMFWLAPAIKFFAVVIKSSELTREERGMIDGWMAIAWNEEAADEGVAHACCEFFAKAAAVDRAYADAWLPVLEAAWPTAAYPEALAPCLWCLLNITQADDRPEERLVDMIRRLPWTINAIAALGFARQFCERNGARYRNLLFHFVHTFFVVWLTSPWDRGTNQELLDGLAFCRAVIAEDGGILERLGAAFASEPRRFHQLMAAINAV
jgi:hypothetical protein